MAVDRLTWDVPALQRQLAAAQPGFEVECVAQIGSSNSELLARAQRGDAVPRLLVAEQQTQGRGRNGRVWLAAAGSSLTFSLSLPLRLQQWSGLSLAVGVALAEALEPRAATPPRLQLKWPNDLWLGEGPGQGRKLGGILIETLAVGWQRVAVIGVGLNVLPQSLQVDTGFACLQELDPSASAPRALQAVALPLLQAVLRFERQGLTPFAAGFAQRDLLHGQWVTTTSSEVPQGMAEGVDDQGALRVRGQQLHHIVAGEVSVRPRSAQPVRNPC